MKKAPLYGLTLCVLAGFMILQILLPAREISDRENRNLASLPSFSLESLADGGFSEKFEAFAADQTPLRDAFVSLHALTETLQGKVLQNDVILGKENFLFDRSDGWSVRNARLNAQAFADLAGITDLPGYLLLVPSSGNVYRENLPAFSPVADEEALLEAVQTDGVTFVPVLDLMRAQKNASLLFFRTDHHWTLEGARIGYRALCEALALPPFEMAADHTFEGFFGSFFARSPSPFIQGDTLSFPDPKGIRLSANGEEKDGLYDREKMQGRDKYAALLYGNWGIITLENEAAPGGTLFVVKDSYANLLLPTLARHYSKIVAADARYFTGDIVQAVLESEAETLVCLFGINTFSQSRSVALLQGL